jgi:integrase
VAKIRLKHVHAFTDRHGRRRYYARIPGKAAVPLPGEPGSPPFMSEYHAATAHAPPLTARLRPGSIAAAIALYFNSADFAHLAAATRADRRRTLERFIKTEHERAALPFGRMEKQDVERILAKKAAAPHAAKGFLKALRAVAKVAVKLAVIADDPTTGVKFLTPASDDGFRMWEEEDIARFEAHWAIGTRERLALAVLLYTGQRRGDVVRLGRQHVKGGVLMVRQSKTGTVVALPVHPTLATILAASKTGQLTFLTTTNGEPFTPAVFTNWFGNACRGAGLPIGLSAHGLRKAMCRRLAEAGCTVHEIQAISGHASLKEIERYTKGVEQKRLAETAMQRVGLQTSMTKLANPSVSH